MVHENHNIWFEAKSITFFGPMRLFMNFGSKMSEPNRQLSGLSGHNEQLSGLSDHNERLSGLSEHNEQLSEQNAKIDIICLLMFAPWLHRLFIFLF